MHVFEELFGLISCAVWLQKRVENQMKTTIIFLVYFSCFLALSLPQFLIDFVYILVFTKSMQKITILGGKLEPI